MRILSSRNSPCFNNKNKPNSSSNPSLNTTTKSPSSTLTSSPTPQSSKSSTYLHYNQPPKNLSHNPTLQPFPIPSRAFHIPWPNSKTNTRPWNSNRWTSPTWLRKIKKNTQLSCSHSRTSSPKQKGKSTSSQLIISLWRKRFNTWQTKSSRLRNSNKLQRFKLVNK